MLSSNRFVTIKEILQILGIEAWSWGVLDFSKFNFILRYGIMDYLAYLVQFFQACIFCLRSFAVVLSIQSKICKGWYDGVLPKS